MPGRRRRTARSTWWYYIMLPCRRPTGTFGTFHPGATAPRYNPDVNEFTHREVPRLGRRLFRLGLSGSFDLDETGCREALERIQYVFWSPRMKALTPALRDALARDRDPSSFPPVP